MNFAISTRGRQRGLDHLGIQVENKDELNEVYARLHKAGGAVVEQGQTSCCYAKSEKSWLDDPAGIAWETFLTTGESTVYGESADLAALAPSAEPVATACGCAPDPAPAPVETVAACCGPRPMAPIP